MRTSTAVPWPTSAATSSKRPGAGRAAKGHSRGSSIGAASSRTRQGKGSIRTAPPASPATSAQAGGVATCTLASGQRASQASSHSKGFNADAASCQSGGNAMPSRVSGVTTSVTQGSATRLDNSPTSETCWNATSVSGASPMLATTCARTPPRSPAATRRARRRAMSRPRPRVASAGQGAKPATMRDSGPGSPAGASGGPSASASPAGAPGRTGPVARAAARTGSDTISNPTAANDSQNPG